jgi:hypothetical protein
MALLYYMAAFWLTTSPHPTNGDDDDDDDDYYVLVETGWCMLKSLTNLFTYHCCVWYLCVFLSATETSVEPTLKPSQLNIVYNINNNVNSIATISRSF